MRSIIQWGFIHEERANLSRSLILVVPRINSPLSAGSLSELPIPNSPQVKSTYTLKVKMRVQRPMLDPELSKERCL
jgi:hypothetical protein